MKMSCCALNGRLEVHRPEARRRGEDHQVDAGGDRLLIGVEADELAVLRHVDAVLFFDLISQVIQRAIEPVFIQVSHHDELHGSLSTKGLRSGPGIHVRRIQLGAILDQVVAGRRGWCGEMLSPDVSAPPTITAVELFEKIAASKARPRGSARGCLRHN